MSFRATLDEVCAATGAIRLSGEPGLELTGVGTDTRSLNPGELFVALRGPQFDGNRFAEGAVAAGAGALLLRDDDSGRAFQSKSPLLLHPEPLEGLGALAAWHRTRLGAEVIAITGSSGKTTCKTIAAQLFGRLRQTVASPKSFNNAIGVPLSILAAGPEHEFLVLEFGTSSPGEIARLCRIARPATGLLTNIGSAHLAQLGSLQGVAKEKGALPASLPEEGLFCLCADDDFADQLQGRTTARTLTFGLRKEADLMGRDLLYHAAGTSFRLELRDGATFDVTSPLLGEHNVLNLLGVLTMAHGLGFELSELLAGVPDLEPEAQRLERHELDGVLLLDDTYNANPDSARAAVRVLAGFHGFQRRVLVLGDMLELGDLAAELHFQVGLEAARSGLDLVVAVGELARAAAAGALEGGLSPHSVKHFEDTDRAREGLRELVVAGDVALIKGSRGMHMEQLVVDLLRTFGRRREG